MSQTVLEAHDLAVSYRSKPVLYGVDVTIKSGGIVGIMGPNGAGKSTFLKTVMGQIKPLRGWVKLFDGSVEKNLHRIGYVPQRESVDWDFPVTVKDVVLMGTYRSVGLFGRVGKNQKETAEHALEQVGMADMRHRQIGELSGGQQQRVFLARALAQQAELYLMDEPFAGVDAATENAIVELLHRMRTEGKTVMIVHHDLPTAQRYFDQILFLNLRLVAFGKTRDVFTQEVLEKTYGGRLTVMAEVAARESQGK
jgi:manganese/zinc/iron transport system ATP- binding protein